MRTLAVALLLALVSCGPPRSDHPLSDPAQAKIDAKLVGSWKGSKDGEAVFFHVMEKPNGFFDAVLVGQDKGKGAAVITFEGFSTELGGKRYLNLKPKKAKSEFGDDWDVSARWLFAMYSVSNGALTLSLMEDELMKAAVSSGKLKGTVDGDDVVVTEETPKLAEFVKSADGAKLFKVFVTLKAIR